MSTPALLNSLNEPESPQRTKKPKKPNRLVSLDAYRGAVMLALAGAGFGIARVAREFPESGTWQQLAFHFSHSEWISRFGLMGVSFWDMIQPSFMFIVGVALPFSFASRKRKGQGPVKRGFHVLLRSVALVLLGVFLVSDHSDATVWEFPNVLAQIGLAYPFVYLFVERRYLTQLAGVVVILAGYWALFYFYPTPPTTFDYTTVGAESETVMTGLYAHWNKNTNAAAAFDAWFLNLCPRGEPFNFNHGGYATLSFIPSIATMLLGLISGQLLHRDGTKGEKLLYLLVGGTICMALGIAAGEFLVPVVKRIWTPSWVLFAGGWTIWALALAFFLVDICRMRWLVFPLVVLGMNSLLIYVMGQLMRPWTTEMLQIHFGQTIFTGPYGPIYQTLAVLVVFWLILFWLYRQRIFLRV